VSGANVSLLKRVREQHGRKMFRYLTGSVVATVVSTITFIATFGPALLGSRGASLAASATGAIANYFLNRQWTWQRQGRASVRHELVPYWATVVVTAVLAALCTGAVNALVRQHTDDRALRTAINTITYLAVYALSFVVKYLIFDRLFERAAAREELVLDSPADDLRVDSDAVHEAKCL